MTVSIPWPDGIVEAWKTTDANFIAQREAEWPHVEYVLKATNKVKKKYLKKHKELFMTGNVTKALTKEDEYMIHLSDNAGYTFFMLWYYPSNDPDAFRQILDHSVNRSNDGLVARDFLNEYFRAVEHFEKEYGLMGERQENVFRALYPSYEYSNNWTIKNGPHISTVIRDISDAYDGAFFNEHCNRYHHGFYIWDYLEHYLSEKNITEYDLDYRKHMLYNILMIIQTNGKRHEVCWKRYNPLRLHDEYVQGIMNSIRGRFKNREFNEGLMWVWDNLETLCEEC
jgi:L-rhamnose mutarotase